MRNNCIYHTDRGNEFRNLAIDETLEAFEIRRSLSHKGCPYDNAVAEATFKIIKTEFKEKVLNTKLEKHTLRASILLHLSPGIIIVLVYIVLVLIVEKHGMPNDFAMYITDFIGLVPVELGILLCVTKRKTKTYNIKSQIPLLKHAKVKEYLIFISLMAIWALLISALLNPIESMIKESFFLLSQ